jgi:hypothetical protein
MTDVRDRLATLASDAGKEIARLGQVETIDVRDELRYRVWPLVADLIDLVQATQAADDGELPPTLPVDVVARAVGLMLSMANRLGELLPKPEMERFARAAAEVTEELLSFCDPDELAAIIGREHRPTDGTQSPPEDAPIDATIVESEPMLVADAETSIEAEPQS